MILIGQIAGVAGVIPPLQGKPAENLKFPQSQSGIGAEHFRFHSSLPKIPRHQQTTTTYYKYRLGFEEHIEELNAFKEKQYGHVRFTVVALPISILHTRENEEGSRCNRM